MTKKINLDEESLVYVLNYILDSIKEERTLAMEDYSQLRATLTNRNDVSSVEWTMILQDLSKTVTAFLNGASTSTANAIKIAKILADYMVKSKEEDALSDDERDTIEKMLSEFDDEQDQIEKDKNVVNLSSLVSPKKK